MRFVAVHPVAFPEEQLAPLAREPMPDGVLWHDTLISYGDMKTYCQWEAPTRQTLADLFLKYGIPVDEIHEVRRFDPAAGRLEPEVEVPAHA